MIVWKQPHHHGVSMQPLTFVRWPWSQCHGGQGSERKYMTRRYHVIHEAAPWVNENRTWLLCSTRLMCKNVWLVIGNSSSRTMPVNQCGGCFIGVSLEVIGPPGVGTTLKKTKLLTMACHLLQNYSLQWAIAILKPTWCDYILSSLACIKLRVLLQETIGGCGRAP